MTMKHDSENEKTKINTIKICRNRIYQTEFESSEYG